jgi:GT2 family glycosyltransferase
LKVNGIVVNFRTADLTIRAVESLLLDGVDEVIVVENGSGDESVEELSSWTEGRTRVTVVVSSENLGFGQGVNLGVRSATGELLLLLNSDAVIQRGGTSALTSVLAVEPAVVAVAPEVVDERGRAQVDAHGVFPSLRALALRTNRRPPATDRPDWVSGVAMLIRRDAFDAVGGFDSRFFMYFEDVDLCRRLRERGGDIRRSAAATVIHAHRQSRTSDAEFFRQYFAAQDVYVVVAGWSAWRRIVLRALRWPIVAARGRPRRALTRKR